MITIQFQNRILYKHRSNSKISLLTLFLLIVSTLFSCADKNDKKENSKIEVVANSVNKHNDNSKQISPSAAEIESEHVEKNNKEIISSKTTSPEKKFTPSVPLPTKTNLSKSTKPEESINNPEKDKKNTTSKKEPVTKTSVPLHKNAELPGGIDQLYTFFEKEYKRPENTSKLNIKISFAVETNGSVSYLESEPAVDKIVETEIIRVLSLSPKWKPGEANGKKTKMQYSLPILLK
jgi:type IV secretory pathway VirB10-like protein